MSEKIQLEPLQEHQKPVLDIDNVDGNVFAIIGAVSKALKKEGLREYADEFRRVALECSDYNDVLTLTHKYVDWE